MPDPSLSPPLLLADVAQLVAVAPKSVSRLVAAGKLPKPFKVGRRLLWDRGTVERFLAAKAGEAADASPRS